MTTRIQDTILGSVLIALSVVWIWLVIDTIPPGFGDGEIGARAFPLFFGVLLLVFAAVLLLQLRLSSRSDTADQPEQELLPEGAGIQWFSAILLLVEIILYGFLLEKIGFVLATPLIVLTVMVVNLRVRSPKKLLGMSLGMTVGCWLVFEKLLGIYLANGIWFNLG